SSLYTPCLYDAFPIWDFFMMVEMGTDRIHHAFWDNMDPAHRFYEPGNKFENAIHDYYTEVDCEIVVYRILKFIARLVKAMSRIQDRKTPPLNSTHLPI